METLGSAPGAVAIGGYVRGGYNLRLAVRFCMLALAGAAMLCAFFYADIDAELGASYRGALDGIRAVRAAVTGRLVLNEAMALGLSGAAAAVFALVMSHRLAGPLWRMEQTARAAGEGDLSIRIRLRAADEMKALAGQMNEMSDGLCARLADISATHSQIEKDIGRLRGADGKELLHPRESLEVARGILDNTKVLVNKLDGFKTR